MVLSQRLLSGSIIDEQVRLERLAIDEGVRRYHKLAAQAVRRGEGSKMRPVERMMGAWYSSVCNEISLHRRRIKTGAAGKGIAIYGPLMLQVTTPKLAVLTMHTALSELLSQDHEDDQPIDGLGFTRLANSVGSAAIAEAQYQVIRKEHKNAGVDDETAWELLRKHCRTISVTKVNWFSNKNLSDPLWSKTLAMHAGAALLWILHGTALINGKPALRVHYRRDGVKTIRWVSFSEEAREAMDSLHDSRARLHPRYLPAVTPPLPWQQTGGAGNPILGGGYATLRTPIIAHAKRSQKKLLQEADVRSFLEHFDSVSATSLSPNKPLIDVVNRAWASGSAEVLDKLGMPPRDFVEMPPKLPDDASEVDIKARKKERASTYDTNIIIGGHRELVRGVLGVAEMMSKYDRVWMYHYMDARGRTYSLNPHLSFQGSEWQRVLLTLAEAKEPGPRGRFWLAVHAANCYGFDKASFTDRAQWTLDHMHQIARAAKHDLDDDWWMNAKQPLPFLAACRAMVNDDEAATTAVEFDGSANGLQHFAALGRDAVAAATVNMTARATPADPYSDVLRLSQEQAGNDNTDIARQALELLDRDFSKAIVMPVGYGLTDYGAGQVVRTQLMDRGFVEFKNGYRVLPEEYRPLRDYIAKLIMDSIGTVNSSAKEIMRWFQQCAWAMTSQPHVIKSGKSAGKIRREATLDTVRWTTPLGLPVEQTYRSNGTKAVRTLAGELRVAWDDESRPAASQDQANGLAPNVVHSYDASHKYMVAKASRDNGHAFRHRHDAYASHAASGDWLHYTTRQKFVELHTPDLLQGLVTQWRRRFPTIKLEDPPQRGDYDINEVMNATYFFH